MHLFKRSAPVNFRIVLIVKMFFGDKKMSERNPKVDEFFNKGSQWQAEFKKLRAILLDCPLNEELKWGVPCYTAEKRNVVLMHGFKEYCALLFVKGALLNDPDKILITQTENTQAAR
jgi:uncharacterized protein YdeI (YjbR/CyaY-like superfamily)